MQISSSRANSSSPLSTVPMWEKGEVKVGWAGKGGSAFFWEAAYLQGPGHFCPKCTCCLQQHSVAEPGNPGCNTQLSKLSLFLCCCLSKALLQWLLLQRKKKFSSFYLLHVVNEDVYWLISDTELSGNLHTKHSESVMAIQQMNYDTQHWWTATCLPAL